MSGWPPWLATACTSAQKSLARYHLSIDSRISPFLPPEWAKSPGMELCPASGIRSCGRQGRQVRASARCRVHVPAALRRDGTGQTGRGGTVAVRRRWLVYDSGQHAPVLDGLISGNRLQSSSQRQQMDDNCLGWVARSLPVGWHHRCDEQRTVLPFPL